MEIDPSEPFQQATDSKPSCKHQWDDIEPIECILCGVSQAQREAKILTPHRGTKDLSIKTLAEDINPKSGFICRCGKDIPITVPMYVIDPWNNIFLCKDCFEKAQRETLDPDLEYPDATSKLIVEFLPTLKKCYNQILNLESFAEKSRMGKLHNSLEILIEHEDSGTQAIKNHLKQEIKKWEGRKK